MKISKYAVLSLALLVLAGCSPKEKAPAPEQSETQAAAVQVLPYVKGVGTSMLNQTLTSPSGETISLIPSDQYHLTVLSLWCPSCFNGSNAQLQELIKLQQEYGERGVRIVVVAYDTPSKEISEAIKNMGITFEMGTGNQTLYDALQMKSIPTNWYLDSAGAVIKTVEGFEALEEMSADIEELVSKYASDGNVTVDTNSSTEDLPVADTPAEATIPAEAEPEGSLVVDTTSAETPNVVDTTTPSAEVTPNEATVPVESPTVEAPDVESTPAPATSETPATITLSGKISSSSIPTKNN